MSFELPASRIISRHQFLIFLNTLFLKLKKLNHAK